MPTKILLDTDIDIVGDIDDAMCLAYLLAQPACELLGITTVTWATDKRAMVASAMCKAAGQHVPIYPGATEPLLIPLPVFTSHHADDVEQEVLQHWDHDDVFPRGQAIRFMQEVIHDHPGEIVLLGIGPLTNIALLFATDREIPGLLKGLVLMTGRFTNRVPDAPLREWNALLDPHATAMVYQAVTRQHRSVGLDVTHTLRMEAADVRQRLHGSDRHLLRDMTELWFRKAPGITFHDPLAAATIFDDRLCRFERGAVEVELTSTSLQGFTHWMPGDEEARHEVAVAVDQHLFFEHYFSLVR